MNYNLPNDWVVGPIAFTFMNDEGHMVPAPDDASFSSTVSDPSMLNDYGLARDVAPAGDFCGQIVVGTLLH